MENETVNNNIDLTPLLEEIQILNEGVISNGERLDEISEFLITKDKAEKKEKEEQEKLDQEQQEKDQEEQLEKNTRSEEETETYTELLTDIRDQSALTNNLIAGQIFFMGVLFGIIFLNVLWNRFIR